MFEICPFCKKCVSDHNIRIDEIYRIDCKENGSLMYQVVCDDCGARGSLKGRKRAAIKAWNTRANGY